MGTSYVIGRNIVDINVQPFFFFFVKKEEIFEITDVRICVLSRCGYKCKISIKI